MLLWHDRLWLIDHGAALYFHHADPVPGHELRPFEAIAEHVLLPFAGSIEDADAALAPQVTEALLRDVTSAVPDEWLGGGRPDLYVEYLGRRIESPRSFVAEAERARAAA
jgi:hypothetical protein